MSDIQITPEKHGGRFKVYASSYAKLDSNVITGGGTDDTEILQAILDKASEWGGLHLVMDGAALIRGLDIHSNTTIECETKDCGFFLAAGANRSVVQNAHRDFKVKQDRNITLLGGTYNHNAVGQEHNVPATNDVLADVLGEEKWVLAMEFYGIEYLTMRDVTIRNQRTFAMLVANWFRVTMENITIELPDNMYAQNQDGIHFWGPGQFLDIRNIMGGAGDDFIALAPDEHDEVSDITDVTIDGVFLNDADQGIRMLSRGTGRLDRVMIRNVSGTFKSFGFYINPWFAGPGGSYGNITFENVDLRQTKHKYEYTNPFLFRIGGNIETLTLKGIHQHCQNAPLALAEVGIPFYSSSDEHIADYSHIGTLIFEDLQVYEKDGIEGGVDNIRVLCPVDSLVIRDAHLRRRANGPLIKTEEYAEIGSIHMSGLTVDGGDALIDHQSGKIGTVAMDDVLCSNMTAPAITGDAEIGQIYADDIHGAETGR